MWKITAKWSCRLFSRRPQPRPLHPRSRRLPAILPRLTKTWSDRGSRLGLSRTRRGVLRRQTPAQTPTWKTTSTSSRRITRWPSPYGRQRDTKSRRRETWKSETWLWYHHHCCAQWKSTICWLEDCLKICLLVKYVKLIYDGGPNHPSLHSYET